MGKIKGWKKLPTNKDGAQWYQNISEPHYVLGVNKVRKGTHQGEWNVYVISTTYHNHYHNIGWVNTKREALKIAQIFMIRNPKIKTI
jgi:hypothetical protein